MEGEVRINNFVRSHIRNLVGMNILDSRAFFVPLTVHRSDVEVVPLFHLRLSTVKRVFLYVDMVVSRLCTGLDGRGLFGCTYVRGILYC
jgi:hypothetical protein